MCDIAIIIPHHNDVPRLVRCLAALLPQVDSGVEVVVIDNASTDSLDAVHTAWPDLRIVVEPTKGAAHARNRGVAVTTAPILAFIDSDCLPAPDWVAAVRRAAPKGDLIGGRVDVFDETALPRSGAQAFETVFAFDFRTYVERKGFSGSGNLVTRREVFAATGGFRHGLSEDLDWCHRATGRGFRLVYDDALRVSHPTRTDWPALSRKWRRLTDEGFGVNGATPARRAVWATRALLMPASIVAHTPRVLRHPALSATERARALATLARVRLTRMAWMLGQAVRPPSR